MEILIGAVGNSLNLQNQQYHGLVYHEALGNAAFIAKLELKD
jgi:O-acetylhomoserine/O-acetylserine sulfhydrylase-like pyridoxal-dependent enzyme